MIASGGFLLQIYTKKIFLLFVWTFATTVLTDIIFVLILT